MPFAAKAAAGKFRNGDLLGGTLGGLPQALILVEAVKLAHDKPGTIISIYSLLLPYISGNTDAQVKRITFSGVIMARLAAFDMDGTLLMPDHRLGDKTLNTLKRLHEHDITLTFATGRHVLEMRHLLGAFSLDAFLITGNGTRIHSVEGDVLHRQDLSPEVADIVLHSTWDTQASVHVFNDEGWFTGREIPEMLHAHVYSGFK